MANQNPTPRQLQLLKAIMTFADRHCYLPTIAELSNELQLSRSTVFEHIAELRRKSLICESPGKARSLKPTQKARKLLKQLDSVSSPEPQMQGGIPLLGKVAAGEPIEAIQHNDLLSLGDFGAGDDIFALQVSGDSMIEEDIHDGDIVICKKKNTANNGQLVVAITDSENATLKRFYKEKSRVRLQPSNSNYEPIYSDNCRIEAVAVGMIRKF